MEKLAIFGGSPVREDRIYYGRQCIGEDDIQAVVDTLRSDYITCGPKVAELEKKLCGITGAKYAVMVSSGTAALHISAMAAGVKPGDEVIVSSITFAASSNCVLYCGGTPVFADIKPDTYNIDPEEIKRLITPKTKGIIAVDFTGQAVEVDAIREICKQHNLFFIEDAAHSIGTLYNGKPVGSLADMTCFSFHPVKTVTAGEGGAVTTNDEETYKKLLLYRSHGITRDINQMVNKTDAKWYNEQVTLGFNYRMTDFQAALLISQLNKLPDFKAKRKAIAEKYNEAFKDMPEIFVQKEIPESDTARHLYELRLDPEKLTCTRREFFDALYAENTCPQVHYLPVYWHSYYESLGYKHGLCPNAEAFYENSMSIPLYPALTEKDTDDVIKAVKKVVEYYRK
ncbi:MAG: UDP-4-amino-4,6-dideoxy-N-acetyl-beta-L-altrosamine transaminase [Acetatifactor sp.]|nr:UDP-4-amino-4,6-dideoxy-N-acetyl-beta-L-altrosamine transaminase [Acetatifactor sp.]